MQDQNEKYASPGIMTGSREDVESGQTYQDKAGILSSFHALFRGFYELTDCGLVLLSGAGSKLVEYGYTNICQMFHKNSGQQTEKFLWCNQNKFSQPPDSVVFYKCPDGLRHIGLPVNAANHRRGELLAGPYWLKGEQHDPRAERQLQGLKPREMEAYERLTRQIPELTHDEVAKLRSFLKQLVLSIEILLRDQDHDFSTKTQDSTVKSIIKDDFIIPELHEELKFSRSII